MQNLDVVIVGAGIVGLTMALALKDSGLNVAVIDENEDNQLVSDSAELRVSAINLASQQIFDNLGVWAEVANQRYQPYQTMQVWDQDSFARIEFSHKDVGQQNLGSIVENQVLRMALLNGVTQANNVELMVPAKISNIAFGLQESFITLQDGSMLTAKLVVGADGANSFVRRKANLPLTFWDYEHTAIVATMKTELAHNNTARQVFTPTGPLAFLPLFEPHLCSIVWSQQVANADSIMTMTDEKFNQAITAEFDTQLGLCEVTSKRVSFPLKMRYCRQWVKDRVALVGDAAHTIHPLAGQGANLGISDAAALAQTIIELNEKQKDFGLAKNLRSYERWRKTEAMKMIATMEGLKQLFGGKNPIKKLIRDVGVAITDKATPIKQRIIKQAVGLDGKLPELAQQLTLTDGDRD